MPDEETKRRRLDRAREFAAKLTSQFARTFIRPPREPLVACTLVIVTTWRARDEAVVASAIEANRTRADNGGGILSRIFYGTLRLAGYGKIEPTGEGKVEVHRADEESDLYEVKTTIGLMAESVDGLAAASNGLRERMMKMPNALVCLVVGVKPGHAALVDLKVEVVPT